MDSKSDENVNISNLPLDLQNIIFSYDNTWRERFNEVIQEINNTTFTRDIEDRKTLRFRGKHRLLTGNGLYFAYNCFYEDFQYRVLVISLNQGLIGFNSLLLPVHKLLLSMSIFDDGNDRTNTVLAVSHLQNSIENAMYDLEYNNDIPLFELWVDGDDEENDENDEEGDEEVGNNNNNNA